MDWVKTLKDLPPPNDAPKILSFLGFIEFFRHWIPNFASLACPLYQAAKETRTGPLTSSSMVHCCFSSVRDTLLQSPALALPKPSKPYHLFTDKTSGIAIRQPNSQFPHLSFFSILDLLQTMSQKNKLLSSKKGELCPPMGGSSKTTV
jgi:hypothetical protein